MAGECNDYTDECEYLRAHKRGRSATNVSQDMQNKTRQELCKGYGIVTSLIAEYLWKMEKRGFQTERVTDNVLCEHIAKDGTVNWVLGRVVQRKGTLKWSQEIYNKEWFQQQRDSKDVSEWRPPQSLMWPDVKFEHKTGTEHHFTWQKTSRSIATPMLANAIEMEYVLSKACAYAARVFQYSYYNNSFPFVDEKGNLPVGEKEKHEMQMFNYKMVSATCVRIAMKFCIGNPNRLKRYALLMNVGGESLKFFVRWEGRILEMLEWDLTHKSAPCFIDLVLNNIPNAFGMLQDNLPEEFAFLQTEKFLQECVDARSHFYLEPRQHDKCMQLRATQWKNAHISTDSK